MKLYVDYEFNCEKENMLENHWKEIWENIEWLPLDSGIIDFSPWIVFLPFRIFLNKRGLFWFSWKKMI